MVKHVVMYKLHGSDELRCKRSDDSKAALLALPDTIECLQSMEVGINENPAEDWDVVLTAVVPSMKDVAVYAKHPAHVAAAAILGPYKEARACVDFEF